MYSLIGSVHPAMPYDATDEGGAPVAPVSHELCGCMLHICQHMAMSGMLVAIHQHDMD
jgi:hypothetical protein